MSWARDLDGFLQTSFDAGVADVTLTRRLNNISDLQIVARSSAALVAAFNANGNPAGTRYYIHAATGTCSTSFPSVGSLFSATTTSLTIELSGLAAETDHQLHIHVVDADGVDQNFPGSNVSAQTREPSYAGLDASPSFSSCGGGGGGNGGLAIGIAPSGELWRRSLSGTAFDGALRRGRRDDPLVGRGDGRHGGRQWRIAFNGAGGAFLGSSSGTGTGIDLTVYRFSAGGLLLSSRTYDSGSNDYALAWRRARPARCGSRARGRRRALDQDAAGARTYEAALWRYEMGAQTLAADVQLSGGGLAFLRT